MNPISVCGRAGARGPVSSTGLPRAYVDVTCHGDGSSWLESRPVICERELTVAANGVELVRLLCSGMALRELAHGFLYSEGVIRGLGDVLRCSVDASAMEASFDLTVPVRRPGCPTMSSGFGGKVLRSPLTGGALGRRGAVDADELRGRRAHVPGEEGAGLGEVLRSESFKTGVFSIGEIFLAMTAMDGAAMEYHATRGMHCLALFRSGEILGCFEDIGRHSTFDKLAGHSLLSGNSPEGALLTTTGRVSAEMCAKALRLGVAAVASCSGPTDAAVRLAREAGVMLVGYAGKPGRAVRYA